jgi:hypothetical protein
VSRTFCLSSTNYEVQRAVRVVAVTGAVGQLSGRLAWLADDPAVGVASARETLTDGGGGCGGLRGRGRPHSPTVARLTALRQILGAGHFQIWNLNSKNISCKRAYCKYVLSHVLLKAPSQVKSSLLSPPPFSLSVLISISCNPFVHMIFHIDLLIYCMVIMVYWSKISYKKKQWRPPSKKKKERK